MAHIQKALVLSTDHIPFRIVDCATDFGVSRATIHQHGYVVFVAPEQDPTEIKEMLLETPQWFNPILCRALKSHCSFIVFDSSAEIHKDFTVYPDADDDTTEEFEEYTGPLEELDEDTLPVIVELMYEDTVPSIPE